MFEPPCSVPAYRILSFKKCALCGIYIYIERCLPKGCELHAEVDPGRRDAGEFLRLVVDELEERVLLLVDVHEVKRLSRREGVVLGGRLFRREGRAELVRGQISRVLDVCQLE